MRSADEEEWSAPTPGRMDQRRHLPLPRSRLAAIEAGRASSLERDVLPGWIATGLRAHRTRGRFIDIGTPGSYAEASAFFGGGR